MPAELEELVGFLQHGNTQLRQIACEQLVGHSTNASLFKKDQLLPVRNLKLLVRDYAPISKNALTILINLSHDDEILKNLANDDKFLEDLLRKITDVEDATADEIAMLLPNLAKSDSLDRIISLSRAIPKAVSTSAIAMDQLMDCFVKGAQETLNLNANFDYLAYFFADISKHKAGREYLVSRQKYDGVVPITKLTVFTEHRSHVRRKGVASTIKNSAFEVDQHHMLLDQDGANLLPYILLPLTGSEEFDDEESKDMLTDLQLLPPDKERDADPDILVTHLETLLLLTTTRDGRDLMRKVKVYPIIRECHLHVENERVREACDRIVQVLQRDEADEAEGGEWVKEQVVEDDDDKIVEIF